MRHVFVPGWTLLLHQPDPDARMLRLLQEDVPWTEAHQIGCRHEPTLPERAEPDRWHATRDAFNKAY